jgi:hypothetical protein
MRALDQQVAFEFGDRDQHAHSHLSGSARQIDPAKRKAVNADTLSREPVNC